MLIAWQTVNAVRRPGSRRFTRGFLVVTPGLTIRDRLRVLQPNDPDSYYQSRELVPADMLGDLDRAKIVITNYHAFMQRESLAISKGGRALLQGRGPDIATRETAGQMLQRVMPDLMGMKNILVLNDEAHHCYREKPSEEDEEGPLKGDDRTEAAEEQGSRTSVDLGPGDSAAQARHRARDRSVRDSVLSARVRLRGGNALPLDGERLLAHGRHRERHREAAPGAGRGQHSQQRDADVPKPLAPHRQEDAEEGPRKGRLARPAEHPGGAPDRARSALRPLRPHLRAVAGRRHRGPAVLHRRVQQHLDIEAGPRLRLGLPARERGRLQRRWSKAGSRCSGTSTSTAIRWPVHAPCSSTASSSNPDRRSTRTSEPRPATRSSGFAARSSSGPGTAGRPRTSPIRTCCARS